MSTSSRQRGEPVWNRRYITAVNGTGTLNSAFSREITPASGYDYSFVRGDLYFARSEHRVVTLSVSSAQMSAWLFHASNTGAGGRLTISPTGMKRYPDWIGKKYTDKLLLTSTQASGAIKWKVYTERI